MLENVPRPIGKAMSGLRAGLDEIVYRAAAMAEVPETITLHSPAFSDGAAIPARFTADGEGASPPLTWHGVPPGSRLVLIAEDPDTPAPEPFVHCIVLDLPGRDEGLGLGELASPAGSGLHHRLGRNSFLKAQYLPPDPPKGHGPHRYVFQLFALDRALALDGVPGRTEVVEAMRGHVLAKGMLIGTYERP
ncbi:hypothetical protein A33M_2864 [Rhodovulum sp. PH10]|uniref:YbhB/YbcL family Raf kinase inhibitor-like protein n=1 Tax=Rhodovulum sp. PH10 TaxID=1187851 RepID=UPI00027C2921|nr:YbhB/YbcL family Raf kinase inhibitor-like protein [Rhodovulum sp. PH10]EJW11667.1 hypothetical protein A33M_2864 [Rhodovulum sp. PH10]